MNSRRAWLGVIILGAIFATNANAQTEVDKLRGCLTIEDRRNDSIAMMASCCQTRNQNRQLQRWSPTANS
jgi:hypothetical protein